MTDDAHVTEPCPRCVSALLCVSPLIRTLRHPTAACHQQVSHVSDGTTPLSTHAVCSPRRAPCPWADIVEVARDKPETASRLAQDVGQYPHLLGAVKLGVLE